jgi:hypothetical protein
MAGRHPRLRGLATAIHEISGLGRFKNPGIEQLGNYGIPSFLNPKSKIKESRSQEQRLNR